MDNISVNLSKSPISYWKYSDQSDVRKIKRLITEEVKARYGEIDLPRLIEICSASITLYNMDEDAVAFIALCDYPNIRSVKFSWPKWIAAAYGLNHLNALNTQFIQLMVFDHLYYPEFFAKIVERFYIDNEFLDFIILLLPPKRSCYTLLNMYFKRVHKRKDVSPDDIHSCYVNNRWLHFGKFALKKASDEDGDKIKINLKKAYEGSDAPKYKKILISQDKYRTCIIEETPSVGDCICLNTKFHYPSLSEIYDLRSVHGFKSRTAKSIRIAPTSMVYNHSVLQPSMDHGMRAALQKQATYGERMDSYYLSDTTSILSNFTQNNLRYEDVVLLDPGRLLRNIPYVTRKTTLDDIEDVDEEGRESRTLFKIPSTGADNLMPYEITATMKRKDFNGQNNAFYLEVFLSFNKKARSIDYMRKIFEFAPDMLNYCLLELPTSSTPPMILNYFHKFEKLDKNHSCELYAAHQLAITGRMTVREGWPCDMEDIIGMTVTTLYATGLHEVVYDVFHKKPPCDKQVFVMKSENILIGVATVSPELRIDYLKSIFELEELMCSSLHRNLESGLVSHFIVSPLFYHYNRFFLKEIMRQTGYTSLFFTLYPKKTMKMEKTMTWPSGIQRWVPVTPRILSRQPVKKEFQGIKDRKHDHNDQPFALFYVNRRIASMTMHLDYRDIVVVGHGVTALSFLENLVYSKKKCYFNFGHIKLVAPDSYVTCESAEFDADYKRLVPTMGKYVFSYIDKIGFPAFVDFICGRMTNINRESRFVEIDFSYEIHYDYLILLCGMQIIRPDMKKVLEQECKLNICKAFLKGKTLEDYYSSDYPLNLFILETFRDVDMFIHFIVNSYRYFTHEDYLVVYGSKINAWTCLNFLLRYIPGHEIAFVENLHESSHYVDAFNNPLVYEACKEKIINEGVKYFCSFEFNDWEMRKQNHLISKVNFWGDRESLSLKCVAFIAFSPKSIHPLTISAINNSGLEFHHKLVIDHKFRTSDPRIYAAGSLTRYSKEFCFDHFNHEYYSSVEVGSKLAKVFLEEACNESKQEQPEQDIPPLEEMTDPLAVSCILPCNVNYLHVCPPGPTVLFEQLASLGRIHKILVTGDVRDTVNGPNYFRILLDTFDKVMDITCFTVQEIDTVSLSRLYGKHEQLLNDLCWRYKHNMIPDLFEYFKQPWANVIYHDRFNSFLRHVFPLHDNIKDLEDKKTYLKLAAELTEPMTESQKSNQKCKMLSILNKHGLDRGLCASLMSFLEYNKDSLPSYLVPTGVSQHEKDNYLMNQLLEPPPFARHHIKDYVKSFNVPSSATLTTSKINDSDEEDDDDDDDDEDSDSAKTCEIDSNRSTLGSLEGDSSSTLIEGMRISF